MPELVTRIHFSNKVQVHCDGNPVDLPAKRSDWVEFEYEGPLSELKESLYGGGERVVTVVTKGVLRLRVLATSRFARDVIPKLRQKTEQQGYFPVTVKDENVDSKITIATNFGGLVKPPVVKRGGPSLDEVEVEIDGFWTIS